MTSSIERDEGMIAREESIYKPLHNGLAKDCFPGCVLNQPDFIRFPRDRIGALDSFGFLVGALGMEVAGALLSDQSFATSVRGVIASLGAGTAVPLIARNILNEAVKKFEGKKVANKYVSKEAVQRAKEFPLTLAFYVTTRLAADRLSKVASWENAHLSLDKITSLTKNIQIGSFSLTTPLLNRELFLGRVHGVFLEEHDIIPFTVSHLLPDAYAARIDAPRLNQAAQKMGFDALFAMPLQPDVALQFAREIRYLGNFQANRNFIADNYPFFTSSPIILPGIASTKYSADMWNGADKFSKDVGGQDYQNGRARNPNLSAKLEIHGFRYSLTEDTDEKKYDFLFHPPGIVSPNCNMDKCRTVESFSLLARYQKGKKEGWAVFGNWGSVLVPIPKQAELIEQVMNRLGCETEFMLFRDHSGAVGVSFPDCNYSIGLPPKVLGVTQQHTIATMVGAVPKEKTENVWIKLQKVF